MKNFYKHCLCGYGCPPQISAPSGAYVQARTMIANNGGSIVCGTPYTDTVGVYLLNGFGSNATTSSATFASNATLSGDQSTWLLICNMHYDTERYIWEGSTTTPIGEPMYGNEFVYQMLPGFRLQQINPPPQSQTMAFSGCLRYFARSSGVPITPYFSPDCYSEVSGCTYSGDANNGNIVAYQSVLPKFLFQLPYTYTVDVGAGFTTVAGNVCSGTYVVQEGSWILPPLPTPDPCPVFHGPSYFGTSWADNYFDPDPCGFNNCRTMFYYINPLGPHCVIDGEFLGIALSPASGTNAATCPITFYFYRIQTGGIPQAFGVQYFAPVQPKDAYGTYTLNRTGADGPGVVCPSDLTHTTSPATVDVAFGGF